MDQFWAIIVVGHVMQFKILTLFPQLFPGALGVSVLGRAMSSGLWSLEVIDLKGFAKKTRVDDTTYGGGPGMVMRADVVGDALESAKSGVWQDAKIFFTGPRGRKFDQSYAKQTLGCKKVIFICGRFEGIDQRVLDYYNVEDLSIGDYVISGGELAAMVVIDACVRLIPGVLGNSDSLKCESFASGRLEHSHYTRPPVWRDIPVPDVLLSGNHKEIDLWRLASSEDVTRKMRTDLIEKN